MKTGKPCFSAGTGLVLLFIFLLSAVFVYGGNVNLIDNPGFESGATNGWGNMGSSIAASSSHVHDGNYSCLCANRTQNWQGPVQDITGKVVNGKTYQCSAWVRTANSPG